MSGAARPKRVALSWSSGKDCAWTLHVLRRDPEVEVVALVTTFNEEADRVGMHAVRRPLVEAQARAALLPLRPVPLPSPCSNQEYESRMGREVAALRRDGVTHLAFGDLFLEDVRAYRVRQLAGSGVEPLFPVWGEPTAALARRMMEAGVRAVLTCVDPASLDRSFAGRRWDAALLDDLPADVDPCGERGEFHTFCGASPAFEGEIAVEVGAVVDRDGFVFADVVPAGAG